MSVLKNAKHENFAQYRAAGGTIEDSYVKAGYKPNRGNAARLNTKDSVSRRVNEIQAGAAEVAKVTAGEVIAGLRQVVELALKPQIMTTADGSSYEKYELSAANRALELLGKTISLFSDDQPPPMPAVIVQYPVERPRD